MQALKLDKYMGTISINEFELRIEQGKLEYNKDFNSDLTEGCSLLC